VILGADLGGTKLAVGRLDERLSILQKTVAPTVTGSAQACLSDLYQRLDDMVAASGAVDAIGVGTASEIDFAAGRIVDSTNLPLADVALRMSSRHGTQYRRSSTTTPPSRASPSTPTAPESASARC